MNDTYWDIITKKLGGDYSEKEDAIFKNLLTSNKEFKDTFNDALKIWENAPLIKDKPHIKQKTTDDIDVLIHKIDIKSRNIKRGKNLKVSQIHLKRRWIWTSVAASIALIIGFYVNYNSQEITKQKTSVVTHFTNPKGSEIKQIYLPDGSKALLKSGTSLTWDDKNNRLVLLDGEALFDVIKNPNKPFIVRTKHTDVKVLGTIFNIQAYQGTQSQTVSVQEGTVEFISKQQKLTLNTQEKASYSIENNSFTEIVPHQTSNNTNSIIFENIDLLSVSIILENRFDKEIIIEDKDLEKRSIYGKFSDNTLSDILQSISLALDIKYVVEGSTITLSKK